MRLRIALAFAVLTTTPCAFGQEVSASTSGPAAAPPSMLGKSDGFASPNGQYGAGLSISREEGLRMYGELGVYSFNIAGPVDVWSFSAIVGGGYKIQQNIELEAMLPMGFFHAGGGGV